MKLNNLRIGTRLVVAFGALTCLLLVLGLVAELALHALGTRMHTVTAVNQTKANLAVAMRASVNARMIVLRNIVLLKEDTEMRAEAAQLPELNKRYADSEAQLQTLLLQPGTPPEEQAMLDEAIATAKQAQPFMDQILALGLANHNDEATRMLMDHLLPVQNKWGSALNRLVDAEAQQNAFLLREAEATVVQARWIIIGIVCAAVLISLLAAWRITHSISRPIVQALNVATAVARGDLTSEITVSGRDEAAALVQALNAMSGNLRGMVNHIGDGSERIRTATAEIASGNLDLSERTERQASALEQSSAALTELNGTVRQNASDADEAAALAQGAMKTAQNGEAVMAEMTATMAQIDEASQQISAITTLIDGIAFQTNILSLNAAVEAARAGEQGRGFAVVASEVRNLAQRSATSAREIRQLIENATTRVSDGNRLASAAKDAMTAVVSDAARVSTLMTAICEACAAQSSGVTQISAAIADIEDATQQNAALVEEASAAAAAVNEQADQLANEVQQFTLVAPVPQAAHPDHYRRTASGQPRLALV